MHEEATSATEPSLAPIEPSKKLLLTPREAAACLSISRSKLYELLAGGLLESITIGTSRRVPVREDGPERPAPACRTAAGT